MRIPSATTLVSAKSLYINTSLGKGDFKVLCSSTRRKMQLGRCCSRTEGASAISRETGRWTSLEPLPLLLVLEIFGEDRLISRWKPGGQAALGLVYDSWVLQGAVKDLAQALDQFLGHWWNSGLSQGTYPFFRTRDQDWAGLKLILAQEMSRSSPWRSHLHPGTDIVITVKSSIKALIGGCWVPDLDLSPLHSTSADLTIMFMAGEKRVTKTIQPVIIPFSRQCQAVKYLKPDAFWEQK